MDALEKFGPGRPGGGGLDQEGIGDESSAGVEGEAGYVSPIEGIADPEAAESYEGEIEAERTGASTGGERGGTGDTRDDVLTDALDDERNPDPTERR